MTNLDEILTPEEHPEHSNFYKIPFIDKLIINKSGELINLNNKQFLKFHIDKDYLRTSVMINGKNKSFRQHRLLALTFIGRPSRHLDKSFSELEVNHIDGNKQNNSLSNLEWVTHEENILHAVENNLITHGFKTLAKNIKTGEIIIFKSSAACAKYFNTTESIMMTNLKSNYAGLHEKDNYVFKFDNGKEWPIINTKSSLSKLGNTIKDSTLARNIDDNSIIVFDTVADCCRSFDIPETTMFLHLKSEEAGLISKRNHVFKYNNNKPWPDLKLKANIRSFVSNKNSVIAFNLITNEEKTFSTIYGCSDYLQIDRRTVSRYIKNNLTLKAFNGVFKVRNKEIY